MRKRERESCCFKGRKKTFLQREQEASEIITKDGDAINYVRAQTEREPVKDGTCLQSLCKQATEAAM